MPQPHGLFVHSSGTPCGCQGFTALPWVPGCYCSAFDATLSSSRPSTTVRYYASHLSCGTIKLQNHKNITQSSGDRNTASPHTSSYGQTGEHWYYPLASRIMEKEERAYGNQQCNTGRANPDTTAGNALQNGAHTPL